MRILIADDNEDLADVMAELLSDVFASRAQIDVVYDGVQAMHLGLFKTPNVALLDVDMPGMTGMEVATAMRQHLGEGCPFLIAVTGNVAHGESNGLEDAFDHVLIKPVDLVYLFELIAHRFRLP